MMSICHFERVIAVTRVLRRSEKSLLTMGKDTMSYCTTENAFAMTGRMPSNHHGTV
jgi:hypothetical protein